MDTGSGGLVWALNGANGSAVSGWPRPPRAGSSVGSTTADLTGGELQRRTRASTNGLDIFDGRSGQFFSVLGGGTLSAPELPDGHHRSQRHHRHHHRRLQRKQRRGHPALQVGWISGRWTANGPGPCSIRIRSCPAFWPRRPRSSEQAGGRDSLDGERGGYWEVASDGGVFNFGNAAF